MGYSTTRLAEGVKGGSLRALARARACVLSRAPAVLVVLLSGATAAAHTTGPAQVERVIDGDTISVRLADGRRATVRLTGIETPETRHPTQGVEPGGPAASAYTTRRLTGATVRRDRDQAGDDQDADGRILRYVVLATGEHVNATLVREGYGTAIRAFPYSRQRDCTALEAQARRGRGMGCPRNPCLQTSRRVPPRGRASRPHPPPVGALDGMQWCAKGCSMRSSHYRPDLVRYGTGFFAERQNHSAVIGEEIFRGRKDVVCRFPPETQRREDDSTLRLGDADMVD